MTLPAKVESSNVCTHCGDPIRTDEWHPITTGENEKHLYTFCSEECHEKWSGTVGADD